MGKWASFNFEKCRILSQLKDFYFLNCFCIRTKEEFKKKKVIAFIV